MRTIIKPHTVTSSILPSRACDLFGEGSYEEGDRNGKEMVNEDWGDGRERSKV